MTESLDYIDEINSAVEDFQNRLRVVYAAPFLRLEVTSLQRTGAKLCLETLIENLCEMLEISRADLRCKLRTGQPRENVMKKKVIALIVLNTFEGLPNYSLSYLGKTVFDADHCRMLYYKRHAKNHLKAKDKLFNKYYSLVKHLIQ